MPRDPEEATAADAPVVATIPERTTLGPVHLTVADLGRSISFYELAIGLRVSDRTDGRADLGVGDGVLLVLHEEPGARPVG